MNRKNQRGQTLIFGALALTVLLGFAGLGIDMGVLRYERRLQQTAADAAAVAAASNLGPWGGVQTGAQNAAKTSGYTDASGNDASQCTDTATVGLICVQVINPPGAATVNGQAVAAGPHSGDANYVEVLVAVVQPTYFMRILNMPQRTVLARAVATNIVGGGPLNGCLWTLGPPQSSIEGVNINGSAILKAPSCGIADDGNFNTKGNKLIVQAGTFGVAGSANVSGPGGTVTCFSGQDPCPTYGMPAAADPLAGYVTAPAVQTPNWGNVTTSGTQTLQPGTYSSITFGKNSVVTLNPGIYYINGPGGVQFNGSATVTGNGVMFYFTGSASINANGGGNQASNIYLTAPSTGPYAGMLMYQDPTDTNVGGTPNSGPTLGGTDNSYFSGALYFPKDQITFFGNNTTTGISIGMVVVDSISLSGNPIVTLLGTKGMPPGVTVVSNAHLVE